MENTNGHRFSQPGDQVSSLSSYASNGKIMLFSGILLFAAILIIFCFHSYARWIFNLRRRRIQILSLSAANNVSASASDQSKGLDPSILKSLPVLVYTSKNHEAAEAGAVIECAVCLSEFEEGEVGRVLPACKHTFHSCCIDMWFHSHSNCPLCRTPVQYGVCKIRSDTVIPVVETADLRKKVGTGRFCSASSPPQTATILPLVQCPMVTSDLVEILVEVPTATSSGEQTVAGMLDMGSGPSGLIGPKPTTSGL